MVLDEFHEQGVGGDTALALCRKVQTSLRPDLRIVIMSATLLGGRTLKINGTEITSIVFCSRCVGQKLPFTSQFVRVLVI